VLQFDYQCITFLSTEGIAGMLTSVRLPEDLRKRLARTAQIEGVAPSEVIRRALERYCETALSASARDHLADIIGGANSSDGGRADDTGAAFRRLLRQRRK
jgi:predicted transcriptional regulator